MDWNADNSSFNQTDNFEDCETFLGKIEPWNFIISVIICATAAIANLLLLFAIYKNPLKCFRNPTSFFIANLGIADLLNSLINIEELLASQTVYKTSFCFPGVWAMIFPGILGFIFLLTFPSVTVLALERYMSIAHPLWHQVKVTSRRCYTWIALVWLVNLIYTGITVISVAHDKSSLSVVLTLYPSVFYLTTTLIYFLAFISIRKQRYLLFTDVTKTEITRKMLELRLRNQNRFLSTLLIINIVLTFGLIPTIISVYLQYRQYGSETDGTAMEVWLPVANILLFLNTAANPFLYIWRLPKYRKTFSVIYCCKNK